MAQVMTTWSNQAKCEKIAVFKHILASGRFTQILCKARSELRFTHVPMYRTTFHSFKSAAFSSC